MPPSVVVYDLQHMWCGVLFHCSFEMAIAETMSNSMVHVVLHRPSAYQSNSHSRMWAGGLVLTYYRPYLFLHAPLTACTGSPCLHCESIDANSVCGSLINVPGCSSICRPIQSPSKWAYHQPCCALPAGEDTSPPPPGTPPPPPLPPDGRTKGIRKNLCNMIVVTIQS